jgi:hypothetical protein
MLAPLETTKVVSTKDRSPLFLSDENRAELWPFNGRETELCRALCIIPHQGYRRTHNNLETIVRMDLGEEMQPDTHFNLPRVAIFGYHRARVGESSKECHL